MTVEMSYLGAGDEPVGAAPRGAFCETKHGCAPGFHCEFALHQCRKNTIWDSLENFFIDTPGGIVVGALSVVGLGAYLLLRKKRPAQVAGLSGARRRRRGRR